MREHLQRGKPGRSAFIVTVPKRTGSNKPAQPKPPVFVFRAHQGKEKAYVDALRKAGYKPTLIEHGNPRFVLYDLDCFKRRSALERFYNRKVPIFMYPHAARPQVVWDGMHELFPYTRCSFVIAKGHEEVMRRYGYDLPIEVTGWAYCGIKAFEPVKEVKNILFAPIHPAANGLMIDVDRDLNIRTYKRLVPYCKENGIQLSVRHIKSLKANGLDPVGGVKYISGDTKLSIADIDAADLVVAHQTFAYMAVARGKPVVMMGEDLPPRTILPNGKPIFVKSWDKYADILAFPLDILAGDVGSVITKACKQNAKVTEWRDRFIGEPFDPKIFVEKLESYLK